MHIFLLDYYFSFSTRHRPSILFCFGFPFEVFRLLSTFLIAYYMDKVS